LPGVDEAFYREVILNIADWIVKQSRAWPDKQALIVPKKQLFSFKKSVEKNYESITFEELEKRSNVYGNGFKKAGIGRGSKVLLFVPPSLDFPCIAFALFKIGAVPVFIDPGMGLKKMLGCIENVDADAIVGIGKVHHLRLLKRQYFKGIDIRISVGGKAWGAQDLNQLTEMVPNELTMQEMDRSELAAILFTSGGTGKPKGVMYTQEMFWNQTLKLKEIYQLTSKDRDLPGFPLFSLFCISMGMTSCVPDMDPAYPAKVKAKLIVQNIRDHQVSFVTGSPAIWKRVGEYCQKKKIILPSVKKLVMFGAPVSGDLLRLWEDIIPHGDVFTPYGATECLPVTNYGGRAIRLDTLPETEKGAGTCVGHPVKNVSIQIIRIEDAPSESMSETMECSMGEVGEILVQSDTATVGYFANNEATKKSKLMDEDGRVWHRMGDLGYLDEWGRLWFCGRKDHYFEYEGKEYFPVMLEGVVNKHPDIERSALVNLGHGPGLILQRYDGKDELPTPQFHQLKIEVARLLKEVGHKEEIQDVFLKKEFPVDTRHNIKIDRKALGTWAKEQIAEENLIGLEHEQAPL
jgi:acyl-CoA synthetase (AMP-forming)/AMP-acid ligase II